MDTWALMTCSALFHRSAWTFFFLNFLKYYNSVPKRSITFFSNLFFFLIIKHVVLCFQVVWIKGNGHKRIIVLKNDMKGKVRGIFRSLSGWKRFSDGWKDDTETLNVEYLFALAKPSSSGPSSPQPGESMESPRDSPISSTTSGTQSPGNPSHTYVYMKYWLHVNFWSSLKHYYEE